MESIKAIIFDLDGTLVDTIDDIGGAANVLFQRHGYPEHSREDFERWIGNGAKKFIEDGIGTVINDKELHDYVKEFKEIYADRLVIKSKLYPGISQLLEILRDSDIIITILSNKPHHLTKGVVAACLADWPFEIVFGQREHVPRKPDPAAALEIAGLIHVDPGDILFVGDSVGDITTALAAGMKPVGVSWGYGDIIEENSEGYDVIHDPMELLPLLNK